MQDGCCCAAGSAGCSLVEVLVLLEDCVGLDEEVAIGGTIKLRRLAGMGR